MWGLFLPFCRRLPLARTLCGACNRANIAAACAAKKQKKCTLSFIFKDLTTKERILSNLPGGRKNILLACHILSQLRPPRKRFNGGVSRTLKICPQNGDICTFAKYYVTHKRQFFVVDIASCHRPPQVSREPPTNVGLLFTTPSHHKTEVPISGTSVLWWEGVDSNHRSRRRQIYSLMHLATLQPARIKFLPRPHWWTGIWSWRLESNPQPADYKSAALPVELRQHA